MTFLWLLLLPLLIIITIVILEAGKLWIHVHYIINIFTVYSLSYFWCRLRFVFVIKDFHCLQQTWDDFHGQLSVPSKRASDKYRCHWEIESPEGTMLKIVIDIVSSSSSFLPYDGEDMIQVIITIDSKGSSIVILTYNFCDPDKWDRWKNFWKIFWLLFCILLHTCILFIEILSRVFIECWKHLKNWLNDTKRLIDS